MKKAYIWIIKNNKGFFLERGEYRELTDYTSPIPYQSFWETREEARAEIKIMEEFLGEKRHWTVVKLVEA